MQKAQSVPLFLGGFGVDISGSTNFFCSQRTFVYEDKLFFMIIIIHDNTYQKKFVIIAEALKLLTNRRTDIRMVL